MSRDFFTMLKASSKEYLNCQIRQAMQIVTDLQGEWEGVPGHALDTVNEDFSGFFKYVLDVEVGFVEQTLDVLVFGIFKVVQSGHNMRVGGGIN